VNGIGNVTSGYPVCDQDVKRVTFEGKLGMIGRLLRFPCLTGEMKSWGVVDYNRGRWQQGQHNKDWI
jgi:hypothetical protein